MEHCTSKATIEKAISPWGPDTIEARMRMRIRETIEMVVEEELEAALGAAPSVRVVDVPTPKDAATVWVGFCRSARSTCS